MGFSEEDVFKAAVRCSQYKTNETAADVSECHLICQNKPTMSILVDTYIVASVIKTIWKYIDSGEKELLFPINVNPIKIIFFVVVACLSFLGTGRNVLM